MNARRRPPLRVPLPVVMQAGVVSRLASRRIRAMVLSVREFGRLKSGDLLWVREGCAIEDRQPKPGEVRVRYHGQSRYVPVPWPAALARPHGGARSPAGMPVELSRYSLRVTAVHERRLHQIDVHEAAECGAEAVEGGYCPPGVLSDSFMPFSAPWEAVGHIWDAEHGHGAARANPDVVLVRFEALAQNICKVAVGMGFGGARR